jgi:hypothetical protein
LTQGGYDRTQRALRGTIAELYDAREYSAAIRGIMGLADRANHQPTRNQDERSRIHHCQQFHGAKQRR